MNDRTTVPDSPEPAPGSALAEAVAARAKVFGMTGAAEDAVLRPAEPGCWPPALRAAMAARIARLNGEAALADRHARDAGDFRPLADPAADGAAQGLAEVMAFMDKVAARTRTVTAADIAGLRAAGVADPDIVRLAELNAFMAYRIRVAVGMRLMEGAA